MPRRIRYRTKNKDKYSVEQTVLQTPALSQWETVEGDASRANSHQYAATMVPPTDLEGMRKVKHLTLSFSNGTASEDNVPLLYALVFVPSGYAANKISVPAGGHATNLYDPNQFVMSCGVLDFSGGPCRIRTPLSRNLNSGDSIWLVLAGIPDSADSYMVNCRYAITLQ